MGCLQVMRENAGKMLTVTPIPTLTFTQKYYAPFNNASWNFSQMAPIAMSTIGDFFGQPVGNQIVMGTIFLNIIGLIWIRQEDAAVPLFLLFIFGAIIFGTPGLVPESWRWFIFAVEALVLGGIIYTLYRGRR